MLLCTEIEFSQLLLPQPMATNGAKKMECNHITFVIISRVAILAAQLGRAFVVANRGFLLSTE